MWGAAAAREAGVWSVCVNYSDKHTTPPGKPSPTQPPLTFAGPTGDAPFARPRGPGSPPTMETPDKSNQGYPEEAPDEVAGDEGASQEGSRDKEAEDNAPDNEDGTATGNPNAAG